MEKQQRENLEKSAQVMEKHSREVNDLGKRRNSCALTLVIRVMVIYLHIQYTVFTTYSTQLT